MSARDRVRRLFESATMNARAVISAIKTFFPTPLRMSELEQGTEQLRTFTSLAEQNWGCTMQ